MTASIWKYVNASVRGTSHLANDTPCQDYHRVTQHATLHDEHLIVVCSDGAGSAQFAEVGAAAACGAVTDAITSFFSDERTFAEVNRDEVQRWCEEGRRQIEAKAKELESDSRQLACTLLGAVLSDCGSCFFQIGDGAIVTMIRGLCGVVFWPHAGEFAGTTYFLTDSQWQSRLNVVISEHPVDRLAVFSDGIERLVLQFNDKMAHLPFLKPMWDTLASAPADANLVPLLHNFLDSPDVNDRTDDDKTLVLALREIDRLTLTTLP